jgi:hypothetical protein
MTELEKLLARKQSIKDYRSGVLLRLRETNSELVGIDDALRDVDSKIRIAEEKEHGDSPS